MLSGCADIETLHFPDHSFDTIVSTLSLCSYDDPLAVLKQLNRWCRPDGELLLMEHGISRKPVVSLLQKTLNPFLYRTIGCHHTRNIPQLLENAGITIKQMERHWLDMLCVIRARPTED